MPVWPEARRENSALRYVNTPPFYSSVRQCGENVCFALVPSRLSASGAWISGLGWIQLPFLRDDIAVVGWACRTAGRQSPTRLWSMLLKGRCAVSGRSARRFPLERFGTAWSATRQKLYLGCGCYRRFVGLRSRRLRHLAARGRANGSATADPSLADLGGARGRGHPPILIAGSDVGVYVGASRPVTATVFSLTTQVPDSYFATGTALAIFSNRISYIYDLRSPSITVDTACSSSLVAFHEAVEALRSGRIDTAIVGGINVIASPASFIAFSQASMLSPTGLCRTFSAIADGFVRGEGGAVFVLRR